MGWRSWICNRRGHKKPRIVGVEFAARVGTFEIVPGFNHRWTCARCGEQITEWIRADGKPDEGARNLRRRQ